jgi:hypothetical protein
LAEPHGSSASFYEPNLGGVWLSLLESRVWRSGARAHTCPKGVAQVDE